MSFLLSGLKHPTHSETLCTGWPRPGFCMPACPSCAKLLAYKLHPQVFSRENSGVLIPPTIWELDSKTLRLKRHAEALTLFMRTPGPELTAVAAAESLQSCPTLCDPMDCSLPGSSVRGIFQARVLNAYSQFSGVLFICVTATKRAWTLELAHRSWTPD